MRRILITAAAAATLLLGAASLQARQTEARAALSTFARQANRDSLEPDIAFRDEQQGLQLGVRCATRTPSDFEKTLISKATMDHVRANGTAHRETTLQIPVVFHVVRNRRGRFDVTDAQIQRQVQVLNDAYGAHGYRFNLQEIRRYKDKFAKKCLQARQERKFKRRNAVDPIHTLNIYTCKPAQGVLGFAYLPSDAPESSSLHGVVLMYSSLPGGGAVPYDEGDTGVHEVGHYLGLFHTFDGGCGGSGDLVADTPAERSPAYGCPIGRDSCPNSPGNDPIFNYMDYTDDSCMDEFTTGQKNRMDDQVATFRPHLGR